MITKGKQIDDCSVLMADCVVIREAVLLAIQREFQRIIIRSNSQLVVNSVNNRIRVYKDIIS